MEKNVWNTRYEIINKLGEGGNANVFHVKDRKNGYECALKCLHYKSEEKKCRFVDEIKIMNDNYLEIEGILPIIDYSEEEFWYTMPIAKSVIKYINESQLLVEDIIQGIIQLTDTLEKLHSKGISHRDIKPSNIYFYKDRFYLGDFGLVEFPDNPNDFTRSDKGLGAIFTIAPEMKRDPKHSDGKKADVFSLAKTAWMLFTGDERGFDGTYSFLDRSHSLRFISKFKNVHLVEIEELLSYSTDNDPKNRPNIDELNHKLKHWIEISRDSKKSQISDWKFLNKYLFGDNPPESAVWKNTEKIINVLNIIGTLPAYNHMLFSDYGGLDFDSAELASETKCLYIYNSTRDCFVVKPKCLYYEGFDEKDEWNYFLLELYEMKPVFGENGMISYERLVEDYPAHYVSAQYAQYGVYDYDSEEPLPKGYKCVRRYLRGKFLIVLKKGPYNGIPTTYDGRHGMCSNNEFREYIEKMIDIVDKFKQRDVNEDAILHSEFFSENPFEKTKIFKPPVPRIKRKESKDFISSNYTKWCFKELFESISKKQNIRFYFTFETDNNSFSSFFSEEKYYLCTDGYIKKIGNEHLNEIYYVYDRVEAARLLKKCNDMVEDYCINNGFDIPEFKHYVSVDLERCGKPAHLFSKQEIEEVMRNADDRHNNRLVIDENGYAKLIQNIDEGILYPVSHESWSSGNVYVGKYSKLFSLDEDYISSLQGWLMYLKFGRKIYMDLHENGNIEELIREIKKIIESLK